MSFELDPVFHTETMVKILHAQGQVFYATKLCEEMAAKSLDNARALALLEGIKKGQIPEKVPSYQAKVAEEAEVVVFDDTTEPGITFEALEIKEEKETLEAQSSEMNETQKRLSLLNEMLLKVQERKYETH